MMVQLGAPDVFFDTMGYAFTFPVVRYLSAARPLLMCYVHYPTISTGKHSSSHLRPHIRVHVQENSNDAHTPTLICFLWQICLAWWRAVRAHRATPLSLAALLNAHSNLRMS